MAKATFGAGCFWGVEEIFRKIPGVTHTTVGYTGGSKVNPTYEDVCTNRTGHAEVVDIDFDPDEISYLELLKVFFDNHNPTTLNQQGPDIGTQYRSVVFYHTEDQKKQAEQMKNELNQSGKFRNSIVTEITVADAYYPAEEYHQRYLQKRGVDSCHI
ncbi:peptide-methionine (S)-S-oxide reductase MsrA [Shimazuella kribbensis]|uniref:peptide-methionine (S)-S-oxide reductase MsrA n=1 Tax=Shimazuella kribbensis TaxID=139808 RepID=UPI0003F7D171|nr:peptide-methionine (S)-S-oxide reductase MsrA [Shimazuella kribbensis]